MQTLCREFKISQLGGVNPKTVKQSAQLSIRAWGRKCLPGEVAQRAMMLRDELKSLCPRKKAIFAATARGRVIGFVKTAASETNASEWWLIGLAVSAAHRRKGVGRALAEACAVYAGARGATKLRSETHADNQTSIRFHNALGFASTGAFIAPDGDRKVGFSLDLRQRPSTGESSQIGRR